MANTFTPVRCLKCNELPTGTVESIQGIALLQPSEEEGQFEYAGETEVDWDTQETVMEFGYPVFWCGTCKEPFVGVSGDIREEDVPNTPAGRETATVLAKARGAFIRLLDGSINNCAIMNRDKESACQVCKGRCPDRARG